MLAVSLSSFLIIVLIGLEIFIRKSDFFSPGRVFLLAHCLALGVAFLALDRAMTPFRPLTSMVYFGGAACFLLGLSAIRLLQPPSRTSPGRLDSQGYNWNLHLVFSLALFLFAFFGLWGAHYGAGGFPLLAENKIKVLDKFMKQPWYFMYPFGFSGLAMALFFMRMVRPNRPPLWRNLDFWLIMGTFGIFSLALSRIALIFFAFFAMAYYSRAVRRIPLGKLVGGFLLCFVLLLVTGYFKAKQLEEQTSLKMQDIAAVAFKVPYRYLANNFWNLDFALNPKENKPGHPTTYGFTAIEGFLDAPPIRTGSSLRSSTQIDDQFNRRASKLYGWNTVTYQWTLFKDFGLPGVLLGSFFIGIALGILYRKILSHPTVLSLMIYCFLAFFVANSIFGFFSESPAYSYGLVYMCITCYACQVLFPVRRPLAV